MKLFIITLALMLNGILLVSCVHSSRDPDSRLEASGTNPWNRSDVGTEEVPNARPTSGR